MPGGSAVIIREATAADVTPLADLHVRTWRATYEAIEGRELPDAPNVAIRSWQWRKVFDEYDGSTFVFLVEEDERLVGFASGRPFDSPDFPGELSKIYLEQPFQGRGLGRTLFGYVARRFLEQGIGAMTLYADARNPACRFFEKLGGEVVSKPTPEDVWYGWRDLRMRAAAPPLDA